MVAGVSKTRPDTSRKSPGPLQSPNRSVPSLSSEHGSSEQAWAGSIVPGAA